MKTYIRLVEPYYWATINKNAEIESEGQVNSLDEFTPPKSTRLYGVVPGQTVVIHQVSIPARGRHKFMAAVPYALEDQLATDVEDLFFVLLEREQSGGAHIAVIERTQMDTWIETSKIFGHPLDGLVPEYFLLPLHPQAQFTLARTDDGQICVRNKRAWGACLDQEGLQLWWQELADKNVAVAVNDVEIARFLVNQGGNLINQWDIGGTFPQWLRFRSNVDSAEFNLLQNEYEPEQGGPGKRLYMVAAMVLLAALLVKAVFDGYEYVTLSHAEQKLDQAMVAALRTAFPDARIQEAVNKRTDMESRLQRLQTGSGVGEFQRLLSGVVKAINSKSASGITIQSIAYRKQELVFTCVTDSFDKLNRFKNALEQTSFIDSSLTSSSSLENKVTGKFSIKMKS